ncbi:MAG: tyrosine-type recombinase/integrase [Myxococcales bacterium]|nr:tyrosine-type recombinase/integrase [Myxococcales bacterium]
MGRRNTGSVTYLASRDKWQVRVTDPTTRKRKSVTVDTEDEANAILEEVRVRFRSIPKQLGGMTLGKYIPRWLAEHEGDYARSSWRGTCFRLRRHVLGDVIAQQDLGELDAPSLHRLINQRLKSQLSWNTRRNLRSDLSAVFRSAIKEGLLRGNPIRDVDVEGRTQTRFYKFNERDLLLLFNSSKVPRYRRLKYQVVFYLGQRADDVWGLKLEDIDLEGAQVTIWCSKQQAQITYPLLPPAVDAIAAWKKHLRQRSRNPLGLLFPSKQTGLRRKSDSGNPIRQLRADCKVLGIKPAPNTRITWHSWRGSLSTALQSGLLGERWTAEEAARILGHRSVQTTRRHYTEHEYVYPAAHMAEKARAVSAPALKPIARGSKVAR